jgi:hypothetical protein
MGSSVASALSRHTIASLLRLLRFVAADLRRRSWSRAGTFLIVIAAITLFHYGTILQPSRQHPFHSSLAKKEKGELLGALGPMKGDIVEK